MKRKSTGTPGRSISLNEFRDRFNQYLGIKRLRNISLKARRFGELSILVGRECGYSYGPGVTASFGIHPSDFGNQRISIEIGHSDICKNHVRTLTFKLLQRCWNGVRGDNVCAILFEDELHHLKGVGVVLD